MIKFIRTTFILMACFVFSCACKQQFSVEENRYAFYGGPSGGIFKVLSETVSDLAKKEGLDIRPMPSRGSIENLKITNSNQASFSVAYASQMNEYQSYENIKVLGYLYGYCAHLAVEDNSQIFSVDQLKGKKVNVGRTRSATWYMAEKFFSHYGIWDDIEIAEVHAHHSAGMFFADGVDAFWIFGDFPDRRVVSATKLDRIRLLDLQTEGDKNRFFSIYPCFSKTIIPVGTYQGVNNDVPTYQDSVLLIANKHVPEHIVRQLLTVVYASKNIDLMASKKHILRHMHNNDGNFGINLPLHDGAIAYYAEKNKG